MSDWPVVAGVLLVDNQGRVLLQHRGPDAPTSPDTWGTPGGHLEPGETSEEAMRRELHEETGLRIAGPLLLFRRFLICRGQGGETEYIDVPGETAVGEIVRDVSIFYGPTTATEDELVLGEGQALAFVAPQDVPGLELALSTAYVLPLFLASEEYGRLASAY